MLTFPSPPGYETRERPKTGRPREGKSKLPGVLVGSTKRGLNPYIEMSRAPGVAGISHVRAPNKLFPALGGDPG